MKKLFKKPESSVVMPFTTDMGFDFCVFLASIKKSKKSDTYISGERWAERWADRKNSDILPNHHTTGRSNKPSRQWFFLKRLIWPKR